MKLFNMDIQDINHSRNLLLVLITFTSVGNIKNLPLGPSVQTASDFL